MKKVRFQSPEKPQLFMMNDSECHSPRPFIEQELRTNLPESIQEYPKVLPYSSDPLQRYENSNSSPYPAMNRTSFSCFSEKEPCWKPSDDLNLSMLDVLNNEPRQATFCKSVLKGAPENEAPIHVTEKKSVDREKLSPLSSIDNNKTYDPPNILVKDNSFFLRRDKLDKYHFNVKPFQNGLNRIKLGKENNPSGQKADIMTGIFNMPLKNSVHFNPRTVSPIISDNCRCHHCFEDVNLIHYQKPVNTERQVCYQQTRESFEPKCICSAPRNISCFNCDNIKPLQQNLCKSCSYHSPEPVSPKLQSTVDQKTMAIERYEQSKQYDMEVEKQKNVSKEKREPTMADLFQIIKLQNEQLQLLQQKVDKFMSLNKQIEQPTITCSTEHVAVNTVENDQHKMSIGVMTSFEMIRTSTVINKEVVKQTNENAQIQCNKAQISIKEVVSKPVNMNFLDGIVPNNVTQTKSRNENEPSNINTGQQTENVCEEKTLNEMSLCNVQVDNATTPLMSPDQTLYLDVRDYSDSEASNNDQSNVGWTYYNKVMTHVNGMLQHSEMPSSASAMYRNMRQQCVQMQIDKTNVSVTKRVKFGDDPLGLHQPQMLTAPATETSLKMNQLAAKYLKSAPQAPRPALRPPAGPMDMSFATRNYMEKHKLLQGMPAPKSQQPGEIPRFLDITALKQQPKFL